LKGKKRQCPAGSPSPKGKGKRHQKSPTPEPLEVMEYDDLAWVAAANNIVVELARTNSLLERSILAAEGSRVAADRMRSGLEDFLKHQREFQALFLGEIRMGLHFNGRMDSEENQKSSYVEVEDEEMEKESRGEENGSGVTIKHTLGSYHLISLYVYALPFPWSNMPHSA
jgi:hypothetical protein